METLAGIRILIDWQSLADEGWNPDAAVVFSAHNQPLDEALDGLLKPMALDYRVVSSELIQIQSRDHLEESHRLEYYAADRWLGDREQIEIRLSELKAAVSQESPGEVLVMAADPVSRTLMVLANRRTQRELRKQLLGGDDEAAH
jgi:hypothetical protein